MKTIEILMTGVFYHKFVWQDKNFGRASAGFFINKENVCKRDDPTVNRRRYWEDKLMTGLMAGMTWVTRMTGMAGVMGVMG